MTQFRYVLDPLCLIGCLAYALNRWVLKPQVDSAFLHSYFNDLWLIPCALPLLLWLQRLAGLRKHDRRPTGPEILGTLAAWSLLFELAGPLWFPVTGDAADLLAYTFGALVSWIWWLKQYEL